jgi:2-oxoglutarate ferredoxin oxidoreductase subunit gamma
MIGFLAAMGGFLDPEALKKSVEKSVPRGTEKMNQKAFETGYQYGIELKESRGERAGNPSE